MKAFTLTMSDKHAAREVENLIPRDVGLTHIREGGEISATHRDAYYTLTRVEQFESPFVGDDASRVVQEEIGGTTYVVTETDGFVSEEVLNDAEFWEWMADDMGIAVVAKTEEPHTGMTCEYTGQVIEEPWYVITWTDSDGEPITCEGHWDALSAFVAEATDTADEENGWMLRHVNITTGFYRTEGGIEELAWKSMILNMNHTGDVDTTVRKWGPYGHEFDYEENYYNTWEFGDHDDENSPINQFLTIMDPEEHHDITSVAGFAAFTREDFSGEFIISVGTYEG